MLKFKLVEFHPIGYLKTRYVEEFCHVCRCDLNDVCIECQEKNNIYCKVIKNDKDSKNYTADMQHYHEHCMKYIRPTQNKKEIVVSEEDEE